MHSLTGSAYRSLKKHIFPMLILPLDEVIGPGITDLLSFYFPQIRTFALALLPPQAAGSAITSGRTVYLVESRYLTPAEAEAMKRLCQSAARGSSIELRGVWITVIAGGAGGQHQRLSDRIRGTSWPETLVAYYIDPERRNAHTR